MAKDQKTKTLVLLDTHALIHRAYHAIPPFRSPYGEPTGALYGLSTMTLRVIRELKPDYIVAAYDLPGPTFRHVAYKEYKGKRPEVDEALISQLQRSHDVIAAFGIAELSHPGFEADDILGTIVEQIKKEKNIKVIIISGDADTFQLVDGDKVVVYTMRKGIEDTIIYDEKKVIERYGFPPKLMPDYKGLKGDPSDNIIGVPGVGEKTATEIIKNFGTVENLYKELKKKKTKNLKERMVKLLLEHEEDALFSKTLAVIRRDVPITFELPKENYKIDKEKLKNTFQELGFNSLVKRISGEPSPSSTSRGKTSDVFEDSTSDVEERDVFPSADNESFVLVKNGEIFGKPDFEKKIVSNDIKNLIKIIKKVPKDFFDVTIAHWVCESTKKDLHLPEDSHEALGLLPSLYQEALSLLKEKNVEKVLYEIEFPLIPILAEMERMGIALDKKFLLNFKKDLLNKISDLEKKIYALAGAPFNINSPMQVGEIIKENLTKKTKTGRLSTKESELIKLKDTLPIVSLVLEYREYAKLLSTYTTPLLELSSGDARVHTTFNQTGTVTGRLSSDSPNLQNIPIKSEFGARVRDAFVASPGYTLVAFDYAQIELKILAAFAKDKKMIAAFKKGIDIHVLTASEINNVPLDKVTSQMRMRAKSINFGIVFGMGVRRLSQTTGMHMSEAQKFYDEYFKDFPTIFEYIQRVKNEVKQKGYVETLFGRKRFFDLKTRGNRFLEAEMERMAFNAVIQGTDADIVKRSMAAIHKKFNSEDVRPLLQIHDELLYEIRDDIVVSAVPEIRNTMQDIVSFPLPLLVEIKLGKRWGSLKKYES